MVGSLTVWMKTKEKSRLRSMASSRKETFKFKLTIFNGSAEKDFHVWKLRIKAVMNRKDLIEAIEREVVETFATQKTI